MIWVNLGNRSYLATAINLAKEQEDGKVSLWIERSNGSGIKIFSGDEEVAQEHKDAIDFAVSQGYKTYELK